MATPRSRFAVRDVRFHLAADEVPERIGPLLERALEHLATGSVANEKRGRRKALYRLALAGGTPDHLLKVNRYGFWDGLRRRLAGSKARRELARAETVAARGVPTPVPRAAGEEIRMGALRACYLLVPIVPGARDLRKAWAERLAPATRRALARAFGALAARAHAAGIDQDDFAPNNFLLAPATGREAFGTLAMIDFERATLGDPPSPARRHAMLAKLARELPQATLGDRGRFLSGYQGDASGDGVQERWHPLWRALETAGAELAARDARRLARVTTRPGRRFAPFRAAGWRGFRAMAPTDVDLEPIASPLTGADLERVVPALAEARPEPGGGALQLRVGPSAWALEIPSCPDAAGRRAWTNAHLLAHRGGLALRPEAIAWRGGRALLVFAGGPPPRVDVLARAPLDVRIRALPALRVFFDRLLALGSLAPPEPGWIAFDPSRGVGPSLLWPEGFAPEGRGDPERRARSLSLARRLLSLPD